MMDDPTAGTTLGALAGAYWETFLETHPLFATALGDPRFDDRLADPTPAGIAAARARYTGLLADVDAIDGDALGDEDRVTRDALREALSADIAERDAGLIEWNVDPLEGVPADFLNVPDYQRLDTPGNGRHMVERWRAMAGYADEHIASLRRSLVDGRVACRAPVERTIDILGELLATREESWPLLAPLRRLSWPGWTTAERQRFADGLRATVGDEIRPAFARLRETLNDEILPAARPNERPGMGHVPGGEAGYRALVRLHTSLEIEPAELHRVGLAEIARIDADLDELAGRTIGTASLADALVALRGDPVLHFSSRDEVFDKAASSLERATAAIPDWFGRLPVAACDVVRMAPHEEAHSTIAYYRQPAPGGSRPGQYYINTGAPETRPRYEAEALAYHESIPGHHLQIAISQELPDLPDFRRHLGPTAFFEGWGLYTERLADEMGLYSGDLDRIGVLSFDAWRAARLVVDTGMHALGWPRERAIEFMREHTALAPNNIANEVDRYIVMPGQALAYKTGQLEMLRLRAEAAERLGVSFDIRDFHDTLLGSGALALTALRGIVSAWVERRASAS
ncbi:MAG: DUF885 domain-containing protein [Chloroflexota bacterium]|nr:DUF885 domain-containing protein [Chloroflexota bacterium]